MPYNTRNYNDHRYNINGTFRTTTLTEAITGTDATQTVDAFLALVESLAAVDTSLFAVETMFVDFLFPDDMIRIQIINKAIADTVRMADWLSIARKPARNEWYD